MAFVVFAGQSNALGFGMSRATLPPEYAAPDPLTWIWSNAGGHFEILEPGFNTGTPANPEAWGPEVAFAHDFRLTHPDELLIIVKSVKGSTGLAQTDAALDWSPASVGEMFDLTAGRIAAARAAAGEPAVDAVFIVQGEQDGFDLGAAQAYGANLTSWLDAIRAEWMGDEQGRVALAEISHAHEGFELVRQAQAQVAAADPFVDAIDAGWLPLQDDGLHYAAASHVAMGDEFFGLYETWTAPPPPPATAVAYADVWEPMTYEDLTFRPSDIFIGGMF